MKSINNRIRITLLCLLAFAALTGCAGKKKADIQVDVAALAGELSAAVTSDTLTEQTSQDMIKNIYYIGDDVFDTGTAYLSSGSTACEIAVIACKDASGAANAEEKLKSRVASQKELYASYNAQEAGRLDEAIIKTAGRYAVLAVVDDTAKAEESLKKAGF